MLVLQINITCNQTKALLQMKGPRPFYKQSNQGLLQIVKKLVTAGSTTWARKSGRTLAGGAKSFLSDRKQKTLRNREKNLFKNIKLSPFVLYIACCINLIQHTFMVTIIKDIH